jgi:hypothetical protein
MQRDGVFQGSPVDIADGYIHLSCASQVAATLDKNFSAIDGLVLAAVDCRGSVILCAGSRRAAENSFRMSMAPCRSERWYRSHRWSEPLMGQSGCPFGPGWHPPIKIAVTHSTLERLGNAAG